MWPDMAAGWRALKAALVLLAVAACGAGSLESGPPGAAAKAPRHFFAV